MSSFCHEHSVGGFAPARYMVVKIACSYSEVVLGTANHTIIYPGSRPLLRGNSPTSNSLILKMNNGYNGVSRGLEKFVKGRWK
jgi:hypothetical protein